MNCLWEIVLAAKESGVKMRNIRFTQAKQGSPYMELSLDCLNQEDVDGLRNVEVNTYYRFYEIFKDMFQPELSEYPQLRASLTNLILHLLAENDVLKGMTREEYSKKMLAKCIMTGSFDADTKNGFLLFEPQKQWVLLSGWLRCYRAGDSLTLFSDMVHDLIEDSIVYHNNDAPNEILIYTSLRQTWEAERKISLMTEIFLDIRYQVEVFYEYHFGILGIEETMIIDEIAIC